MVNPFINPKLSPVYRIHPPSEKLVKLLEYKYLLPVKVIAYPGNQLLIFHAWVPQGRPLHDQKRKGEEAVAEEDKNESLLQVVELLSV